MSRALRRIPLSLSAALLLVPLAALHTVAAEPQGPTATKVQTIIVVCKTHFDLGYTHRVKDLVNY